MFGAHLIVGARGIAELDHAMRAALDEIDVRVVDAATVADSERGEWVKGAAVRARMDAPIEAPSLAFGIVSDQSHAYGVDVRGPRSPLWHLGLTQRLSRALGGLGASLVNDRLRDDYGYGFFLAGHAVEGGVCALGGFVAHFGIDPGVSPAHLYDALDEYVNMDRFRKYVTLVADDRAAWPHLRQDVERRVFLLATKTGEPIEALDTRAHSAIAARARVEGGLLPWLTLSGSPRVIGVLAGIAAAERVELTAALRGIGCHVEHVEVDPTYQIFFDGTLDELPVSVLLVRAAPPVRAAEVLDVVARSSGAAAIVELGVPASAINAWSRCPGAPFDRLEVGGVAALARAWQHVASRTQLNAMRWTFPDGGESAPTPYR